MIWQDQEADALAEGDPVEDIQAEAAVPAEDIPVLEAAAVPAAAAPALAEAVAPAEAWVWAAAKAV
ncbi:MAG: hypothetical protein LIO99_04905 [Clostridiales bacterium]|nr:hypothetical protein [Clostridiales bacterium]